MNTSILNTEIQNFIDSNIDSDINTILLKGINFDDVSTSEIVEQIESKKRSKQKLTTWFKTQNIYYPNKLNIEQTSSEITAKYKSELIKGNTIIDITGGFGVDCYYFSKHFKNVTHCEINEKLSKIVNHNFKALKTLNIETINTNGLEFLRTSNKTFNWIYIDPSRRHDTKGKVFFLKDCLPNVPDNLELLFNHSDNILIKTSPLLDISAGIKELNHVKTIHVIAVNNDVKELLWILQKDFSGNTTIKTANIKIDTTETFIFQLEEVATATKTAYSKPLNYLYEPNAAILKSGAFHQIAEQFNIFKLHQHSHLYTSEVKIEFPGRVFRIEKHIPFNKKAIKALGIKKANITTRNFPESVQQLRKKFKIVDGGDKYLFFTTDCDNQKIAIITKKHQLHIC